MRARSFIIYIDEQFFQKRAKVHSINIVAFCKKKSLHCLERKLLIFRENFNLNKFEIRFKW